MSLTVVVLAACGGDTMYHASCFGSDHKLESRQLVWNPRRIAGVLRSELEMQADSRSLLDAHRTKSQFAINETFEIVRSTAVRVSEPRRASAVPFLPRKPAYI